MGLINKKGTALLGTPMDFLWTVRISGLPEKAAPIPGSLNCSNLLPGNATSATAQNTVSEL